MQHNSWTRGAVLAFLLAGCGDDDAVSPIATEASDGGRLSNDGSGATSESGSGAPDVGVGSDAGAGSDVSDVGVGNDANAAISTGESSASDDAVLDAGVQEASASPDATEPVDASGERSSTPDAGVSSSFAEGSSSSEPGTTDQTSSEPVMTDTTGSEVASDASVTDSGATDAGTEDDADASSWQGPICGFDVDESSGITLADVLPDYLAQADAGTDASAPEPCYPPCLMALIEACRPAECATSSEDVSCWENGAGQRVTVVADAEREVRTETAYLSGAPCITGEVEFEFATFAAYYKWWDGQGNLVATAEYTNESYYFLVGCGDDLPNVVSDRESSSCMALGNAVFPMCN